MYLALSTNIQIEQMCSNKKEVIGTIYVRYYSQNIHNTLDRIRTNHQLESNNKAAQYAIEEYQGIYDETVRLNKENKSQGNKIKRLEKKLEVLKEFQNNLENVFNIKDIEKLNELIKSEEVKNEYHQKRTADLIGLRASYLEYWD